MKVYSVQPSAFGANAKIKAIDNKKHPFLYNEVLKLSRIQGIPVNFRTHEIELPSVDLEIYKKLNELKIRFYSGKKHLSSK